MTRNARRNVGASGYDPAKDLIVETLWKKLHTYPGAAPNSGLRLVVRRYDGGAPKVALEEVFLRKSTGRPGSKSLTRIPCALLADATFCAALHAAGTKYGTVHAEPRPAPSEDSDLDVFAAE